MSRPTARRTRSSCCCKTTASASYDSISIDEALQAFVSQATASIIAASVPANGSDLAAIEFDVPAGAALGSTGDLKITVLGSVSGQPIDVVLTVPVEVVASAPVAQGVTGVGVPMPDPGGSDSDGDEISDALEITFGSDPNDPLSTPGSAPAVPAVHDLGLASSSTARAVRNVARRAASTG
jgi:hypothetical protein